MISIYSGSFLLSYLYKNIVHLLQKKGHFPFTTKILLRHFHLFQTRGTKYKFNFFVRNTIRVFSAKVSAVFNRENFAFQNKIVANCEIKF